MTMSTPTEHNNRPNAAAIRRHSTEPDPTEPDYDPPLDAARRIMAGWSWPCIIVGLVLIAAVATVVWMILSQTGGAS